MNSLLYYYNNVQKMAAYQQAKRMQRGVKLGYGENNVNGTNKFNMPPISIGTSDFTLEYFGNAYGSTMNVANNFLFQNGIIQAGASHLGKNDLHIVSLGRKNSKLLRFTAQNEDEKFHLVIARKVSEYTVTINNLLYDTVDMGEVKDLGNFSPVIMNSSDVGFVRVWNYALSADEIATLYNNGDPMGDVVPKAKRDGLLAEYLPQNLMYGRDDKKFVTSWLDSAKQLPLSDEYMEPLFQSIGGYDMTANGAPEILYNE